MLQWHRLGQVVWQTGCMQLPMTAAWSIAALLAQGSSHLRLGWVVLLEVQLPVRIQLAQLGLLQWLRNTRESVGRPGRICSPKAPPHHRRQWQWQRQRQRPTRNLAPLTSPCPNALAPRCHRCTEGWLHAAEGCAGPSNHLPLRPCLSLLVWFCTRKTAQLVADNNSALSAARAFTGYAPSWQVPIDRHHDAVPPGSCLP